MSRWELYRLFRQAKVTAGFVGEGAHTFRARLSSLLRDYFHEEKQIDTRRCSERRHRTPVASDAT
jgi:hypothetical protein